MTKVTILVASAILIGAASPAPARAFGIPAVSFTQARPMVLVAASTMTKAELQGLIGHGVIINGGQKIGNIEAVHVNSDGTVKEVIVGVGSFLGGGDRDVALSWSNLHFGHGGRDITVPISKTDLAAMPKYEYASASNRGTVFGGAG